MKLIYHFLYLTYAFFSLDAVKKSSKKKEARIQKEIVEVLQQASYRRKRSDDEILGFDLRFVG